MLGSPDKVESLMLLVLISLATIGPVQGFTASSVDLSVSQEALMDGKSVAEVPPGHNFFYNITVKNNDPSNDALMVNLLVKMPYDAIYIDAKTYPTMFADFSMHKSGDLLEIGFEKIASGSMRFVNISLTAPLQAPDTLYSIANLRYANDPNLSNNAATLSIYVPFPGYNKTAAVKSFEDLLHNQSYLLFCFQNLLLEIPRDRAENYSFIASFEQLLRSQAALTSSFEDLLSSSQGWDRDFGKEERTYLLKSYENMLRDEAFLFAGFEVKLTQAWLSLNDYTAPGHSMNAQWELLASLEDLLKRQAKLYKGFVGLLQGIDEHADPQEREALVDFLASLEDLLRLQSNLLMSFEDLMSKKYDQLGPNNWEEYQRFQARDEAGDDWYY